jgi:hypothetical protein
LSRKSAFWSCGSTYNHHTARNNCFPFQNRTILNCYVLHVTTVKRDTPLHLFIVVPRCPPSQHCGQVILHSICSSSFATPRLSLETQKVLTCSAQQCSQLQNATSSRKPQEQPRRAFTLCMMALSHNVNSSRRLDGAADSRRSSATSRPAQPAQFTAKVSLLFHSGHDGPSTRGCSGICRCKQ